MLPIGPAARSISLTSKFVPALVQADAADRNFAESPFGQIIPIYFDTQPQPAGAATPPPTADGAELAEMEPVWCRVGRGWPCPDTFDIASAAEWLCADTRTPSPKRHNPVRVVAIASSSLEAEEL